MTKGEADAGKGDQAGQSQVSRFWTLYKLNISVSKPSTQAPFPASASPLVILPASYSSTSIASSLVGHVASKNSISDPGE
jgi:hypothetical protein